MKIQYIIFAVIVIAAFLFGKSFSKTETSNTETITYDTIKGDSIPYPVVKYKPVPVYRDTGSTKWKYNKIDTSAILEDYFAKYFYNDTLIDNEFMFVSIKDTVSENKIIYRKPTISYFPTYITKTVPIKNPVKRKLYIGGSISGFNDIIPYIGVMYLDKKNTAVTLQYGVTNDSYQVGMFYKISLKKGNK